MFPKSFEGIDHADIQWLLDNEVTENQNLEYKERVWGQSDGQIREMLKDISGMANAYGGLIIIGISEDSTGKPVGLSYMNDNDAERKKDWISQCCMASLEPRIPGLNVDTIRKDTLGSLIKIYVPRSLRRPHMVLKDSFRIHMRHGKQVDVMSVAELRDAFFSVDNLQQKMSDFIVARKTETLKSIQEKATYLLGAAPLSLGTAVVDVKDNAIRNILKNPPDQRGAGYNVSFASSSLSAVPTLHGLIIGGGKSVQLMRNGYYQFSISLDNEAHVGQKYYDDENRPKVFRSLPIVEYCVSFFRALKGLRQHLGLEESYIAYLEIFNIAKYGFLECFQEGRDLGNELPKYYSETHLPIDPMEIYDFEKPDRIAKEFLDRIWNAFQFEEAPFFSDGQFDFDSRH